MLAGGQVVVAGHRMVQRENPGDPVRQLARLVVAAGQAMAPAPDDLGVMGQQFRDPEPGRELHRSSR